MQHKQLNYISSRSYIDIAERFIDIGFWNVDMSTGEVRGTDGFFRVLGLPVGEPLSLHGWAEMLAPEDREDFRSMYSVAAMGVSVSRELRLLDGPRPARWVRIMIQEPSSGDCTAGIVQNIAVERMSKAALYRERARFDALVSMQGGSFWAHDVNGVLADFRDGGGNHGLPPLQMGNRSWLESVHPDDRAQVEHLWSTGLNDGTTSELPCRLLYADGVYKQVVVRMTAVRQENGAMIEWLGLIEETWQRDTRSPGSDGAAAFWPQQLRAARVLLGWSVEELAREAGVSTATVRRYETTGDHTKETTVAAIAAAFRRHGLSMTVSPVSLVFRDGAPPGAGKGEG